VSVCDVLGWRSAWYTASSAPVLRFAARRPFTKILSSARAASGVSSGGSGGSYARDADYYQILAYTRALDYQPAC
jgi:hypothetical protein